MADKRTEPGAEGGRRRKRAAPTIELTATEVTPPAEPEATPDPAPAPEPEPAPAAAAAPAAEPPPAEPPPAPPPSDSQEPPPEAAPPPPHTGGPSPYGIALVAGIVGAIVVIGVLAGLWYANLLPLPTANDEHAQIAALQSQVQALQKRPPPDNKAIDALRARVDALASEIAKLPPGDKTVGERLATTENALKSLGIALTALNHRSDDIAAQAKAASARADAAEKAVGDLRASLQNVAKSASGSVPAAALNALQTRVAALEQSVKSARAEIGKTATGEHAVRLTLAAAALRDAVVSGSPYAAELAQAKALGANDKLLAPLTRFAQSGVPSRAALAQQLSALLPALRKAAGGKKTSGGFLNRLQANAGKLVHIEPIGAPQGAAPADVLARLEVDAAKADIDGALADLAKLPEKARAPAQGWIALAKARAAALAAARELAADTARGLGKS